MAKRKTQKTPVINGFQSVQAVKHSGKGTEEARTRDSATRLPERKRTDTPSDAKKAATRIGSTAMPARHELTCYECGFEFVLTGRLDDTICAKCRKSLKIKDYTVSGEWAQDVKTLGTIDVTAGAVVGPVNLVCGNLVVAGNIEACTIKVCRRTTICKGAHFDLTQITFTDLVVNLDCILKWKTPFECRHLEVLGTLSADVHATGRVTIQPDARFEGKIAATGLTVEDGGALKADLALGSPVE